MIFLCFRQTPKVEKFRSAVHELYMRPYNYVSYEMGGGNSATQYRYQYHTPSFSPGETEIEHAGGAAYEIEQPAFEIGHPEIPSPSEPIPPAPSSPVSLPEQHASNPVPIHLEDSAAEAAHDREVTFPFSHGGFYEFGLIKQTRIKLVKYFKIRSAGKWHV